MFVSPSKTSINNDTLTLKVHTLHALYSHLHIPGFYVTIQATVQCYSLMNKQMTFSSSVSNNKKTRRVTMTTLRAQCTRSPLQNLSYKCNGESIVYNLRTNNK